MLISTESLKKNINDKCILKDASFTIEDTDKIALIGVNGTGKSTLLKILAGIENYDSGIIIKKNGIKIHYLPQNPEFKTDCVWDEIQLVNSKNEHPVAEFELKSILTKLGITDYQSAMSNMSGGQRKRVALALALCTSCDLLLLDEPTNHLDNDMVEWLENYLIRSKSAIFMVTHDRYFLDRVCTKMIELDQGDLYIHNGNYEVYLENKETRIEQEKLAAHKHKNLYKKELEWVRAGVQARGTKSNSRLQRFEELRQKRFKQQEESLKINATMQRLGNKTIECMNLGFNYPEKSLFHDFNYTRLNLEREFVRNPDNGSWSLTQRPGNYRIWTRDGQLNEIRAKNTLLRREQELSYVAETKLEFYPDKDGEQAGLTCYYSTATYARCSLCYEGGRKIQLVINRNHGEELVAEVDM